LGYVLERIDGAVYHSIIERRILNRIGMPSTVAVIDDALRTRLPASYTPWRYNGEPVEPPWFNPERYRFDSIVDGAALRLLVSGMPFYRIDDR
jgi:CubicO group peptidase (beta-lactamase class C family)